MKNNIVIFVGIMKKRRYYECEVLGRKKPRDVGKKTSMEDDEEMLHLPNPMIGFGVPTDELFSITKRTFLEAAIGPPYFYYEIEPEFGPCT